jgi:S1-C subfamily serine protease
VDDGGEPSGDPEHSTPARRLPSRARIAAALVVTVAVAATSWWVLRDDTPPLDAADLGGIVDKKVGKALDDLKAEPAAGVGIYAAVRPGLVLIESTTGPKDKALGTGIIVNAAGQILTALHVVEGAKTIRVGFADGTETTATVASSDADHDVAVLTAATLPEVIVPAVLGGGAQIGDETFAVGHPLGLVGSLSAGVISGLDRSFKVEGGREINGLIQFDAAVNPGNSGGPLLNRKGQVIGIVTGLANPVGDADFVGIGFAVPIGTAGRAAGAPSQ